MARAYFYILERGPYWTVRYERRDYEMFSSEAAAYSQAMQWARDQGKDGHDAQVFTRRANGKYRVCWSSLRDPYPTGVPRIPLPEAIAAVPAKRILPAALAIALVLAVSSASAQEPASGTLEICRQAGIVDVNAGKPIAIPSGATFVDNSPSRNNVLQISPTGDTTVRIRVATTAAAQIPADARCTVAPARISRTDAGTGARVADGKQLSAARGAGGLPADWPGNLYLEATVATDFR
jgi:hypothetical protein